MYCNGLRSQHHYYRFQLAQSRTQQQRSEGVGRANSDRPRQLHVRLGEIALGAQQLRFYFLGSHIQRIACRSEHTPVVCRSNNFTRNDFSRALILRLTVALSACICRSRTELPGASDAQKNPNIVPSPSQAGILAPQTRIHRPQPTFATKSARSGRSITAHSANKRSHRIPRRL